MTVATITGPCVGGCGRDVARDQLPDESPFAEIHNRVPLICAQCAAADDQAVAKLSRERDDKQAAIRRRQRQGASGLPPALRRIDLDRLDTAGCERAISAARGWAARQVRGLLLTGPFGTGKSTIAAGALWLLLYEHWGRWISAPQLLNQLGAPHGSDERENARITLAARHALVLDDLDKTRPTEYGAEQIFLAVDNAYSRGQQLLVTTNLDLGQLAQKWPAPFGEAIASRLVEHCHILEVAGRDRRLAGRSEVTS